MLTSQDLQVTQDVIKKAIKATLDRPDCDFDKAKQLVELMSKIDTVRRETWHNEKFGFYDNLAQSTIDELEKDNEDIPF